MSTRNLNDILDDIFKNNPDSIKGIGDIKVPDMDVMMDVLKAKSNSNVIHPVFRVKRNKITLKRLLTAMSIIILVFIVSIFYETSYAKAFRLRIVKTFISIKDNIITIFYKDNTGSVPEMNSNDSKSESLSIEQVKDLPFHLYIPEYLPDNFKLGSISWKQYPDNMHMVQQTYIKDENDTITIIQIENRSDENSKLNINSENSNIEIIDINGLEITLISTNGNITNAIWYKGNAKYEIISSCSKNESINIIKSLK